MKCSWAFDSAASRVCTVAIDQGPGCALYPRSTSSRSIASGNKCCVALEEGV
jgi:hypothetical protein